jgi:PLP dependent protein
MIAENLKNLREKIEKICGGAARSPEEVKLIAVSKTFGTDVIKEAYELGLRDFGENKAQELDEKYNKLGEKITWHFIGHLQRNKVRLVVNSAEYIHSVDSLMLASEINKRAGVIDKIQKVLLQVKTSSEETKFGIEEESEIVDLANYCKDFSNIEAVGLMTIAPLTDNKNIIRKSFSYLRKLRDELNEKGFGNIKELSMGMTADFDIAIEEGATMIRVGSAIFGERDYSKSRKEK